MSRVVTVGYDGSPSSLEAVGWAAYEASVDDSALRIVSCYEVPAFGEAMGGWPATDAVGALIRATEEGLETAKAAVLAAHPGIEVTTEASGGPASVALLKGVEPTDLVVVGGESTHGGAAAFWLGSTPRYVVRHCPCPVAIVHGAASRGRPDRIVVGVDGSDASDHAVRWAADTADRHEAELVVVHGWSYPYLLSDTRSEQARDLTQIDAALVLERAVAVARNQCISAVTSQLVENSAVSALLDSVRDGDLLVLGSRGRSGLAAGLFGSTVNSVVERSAVPVVVVRRDTVRSDTVHHGTAHHGTVHDGTVQNGTGD